MADPGDQGRRGAAPSLFLDQTEARSVEKHFFGDQPPTPLFKGRDDQGPPYLKVWIWHWKQQNTIQSK